MTGQLGIGNLTIRKRGIDTKAADWRKRLRTGGPNAATLVFTRDRTDRWVVYAGRTDAAGQGLDAGGTPDGATT